MTPVNDSFHSDLTDRGVSLAGHESVRWCESWLIPRRGDDGNARHDVRERCGRAHGVSPWKCGGGREWQVRQQFQRWKSAVREARTPSEGL
jgi:hypothetical protein